MQPTAALPVFTERQTFLRHWWGLMLLTLVPGLVLPSLVLLADSPRSSTPTTWVASLLVLAVGALVLAIRLEVRLDAAGVHYRLWPLHLVERQRPWADISRAYVRSYDPLGEYGGWGLKGTRRNRALNVAGSEGIQLELADGTRLLLGTQRPAEARQALAHLVHPTPPTQVASSL